MRKPTEVMKSRHQMTGRAKEWFELAQAHIQRLPMNDLGEKAIPSFGPSSEEFRAWDRYFRERWGGWRPYVMHLCETKQSDLVTMPAQWPEWFDAGYVP